MEQTLPVWGRWWWHKGHAVHSPWLVGKRTVDLAVHQTWIDGAWSQQTQGVKHGTGAIPCSELSSAGNNIVVNYKGL